MYGGACRSPEKDPTRSQEDPYETGFNLIVVYCQQPTRNYVDHALRRVRKVVLDDWSAFEACAEHAASLVILEERLRDHLPCGLWLRQRLLVRPETGVVLVTRLTEPENVALLECFPHTHVVCSTRQADELGSAVAATLAEIPRRRLAGVLTGAPGLSPLVRQALRLSLLGRTPPASAAALTSLIGVPLRTLEHYWRREVKLHGGLGVKRFLEWSLLLHATEREGVLEAAAALGVDESTLYRTARRLCGVPFGKLGGPIAVAGRIEDAMPMPSLPTSGTPVLP